MKFAFLNGNGDLGMDGTIRPYIDSLVEIVRVAKDGLYEIRTGDKKLFRVPKRNLVFSERPHW